MISIEIINLYSGRASIVRGNEESVEKELRTQFSSYCHGVAFGDLHSIIRELVRSTTYSVKILDGEQEIKRKPHLNPLMRPGKRDPWEREVDLGKSISADIPTDPENFD